MAEIIPFAPYRFTPADMALWQRIAAQQIRRGLWHDVARQTDAGQDQLLVRFPGMETPILRLLRDRQGEYRMSFHDRTGWYEFRHADNAAACLARRTAPANRPGNLPAKGTERR